MESNSGCGNANAYFVNLTFAFANRVPYGPKLIRHGKKRIKKTSKADEGPFCGPLGPRRSPLPTAGISLPDVDSARRKRPGCVSPSPPPESRVLLRATLV